MGTCIVAVWCAGLGKGFEKGRRGEGGFEKLKIVTKFLPKLKAVMSSSKTSE